jgi:hypothetical protein
MSPSLYIILLPIFYFSVVRFLHQLIKIPNMSILITLLMILVYVALFYLIIYLFSKYVTPIDQKILGILIFVFAAALVIMALSGHSLVLWK